MFIINLLNASPVDGVAIVLCLISILWCVRVVPRRSRSHHLLLGLLGIISAFLATRVFDAMIAMLFLGAAVVIEISDLARRREGVHEKMLLRRAG